MSSRSSRRRGFTLIELLVVIAIIAILAAILFPVFAKAREQARKTQCMSNIKQITLGVLQYTQDYDERYPLRGTAGYWGNLGSFTARNGGTYALVNNWSWRWACLPYIKNTQIFTCPDMEAENEPLFGGDCCNNVGFDCQAGIYRSYAGANNWAQGNPTDAVRKLSEVTRPATIIMLLESREWYPDLGTWTINWTVWFDGGKGMYNGHGTGRANWSFHDGHVKSLNPCTTFGRLNWNLGDVPPDDYLWEWWTGVDPGVLRGWLVGCRAINEYK